MTDEWLAYSGLDTHFNSHQVVNHRSKEYVRGVVHTNGIEGFWVVLKQGLIGIYHHVDEKHLNRYINEFEFRDNNRHIQDAERFSSMLSCFNGRLMYKELINS